MPAAVASIAEKVGLDQEVRDWSLNTAGEEAVKLKMDSLNAVKSSFNGNFAKITEINKEMAVSGFN